MKYYKVAKLHDKQTVHILLRSLRHLTAMFASIGAKILDRYNHRREIPSVILRWEKSQPAQFSLQEVSQQTLHSYKRLWFRCNVFQDGGRFLTDFNDRWGKFDFHALFYEIFVSKHYKKSFLQQKRLSRTSSRIQPAIEDTTLLS